MPNILKTEGDEMENGTVTMSGRIGLGYKCESAYGTVVTTQNTKENDNEQNLRIMRLLYGVGIRITSIGFHYFYAAILICMKDMMATTNAHKNIYMVIADNYKVSSESVERAMRNAFNDTVSERALQIFQNEMRILSFDKSEELTLTEFIGIAAWIIAR